MQAAERITLYTTLTVERWDAEQAAWLKHRQRDARGPAWEPQARHFRRAGVQPYAVTEDADCNMVVQAGWVALLGGIAGATIGSKFSATAGRIGFGTSTAASSFTQTQLQADTGSASTTSYYQLCGSAPAINTATTPPTLVFTATFGQGIADFAWNEFGTDNYTASGVTTQGTGAVFFNRGVSPQGTKPSGEIWAAMEWMSCGYPSGVSTVQ